MSGPRAGCPGWTQMRSVMGRRMSGLGPDVRLLAKGRMSGLDSDAFCDGAPDVRAGAGCPVDREGPDVRASGRMSGLAGAAPGGSVTGRRMSGLGPDVRACRAGCPGPGRMSGPCSWLFSLLLPLLPRTLGLGPWALHSLLGCT
jgi:hypothetical protein